MMPNGIRGRLREAFKAQQARELAAAPRCRSCGRPLGRYVPTRVTLWQGSANAGLETDGDIGACTCPTPKEGAITR